MSHLIITAVGVALILFGLRDIFYQLIRPSGKGGMNQKLVRVVWGLFRRVAIWRPAAHSLAGPLAFICVMVAWATTLAVGWALIYWPRLTDGFLLSPGLDSSANTGFLDALYFSLVSLATLGYGDITPQATGLRLLATCEALIGFALFSAGITWLLSMYPALSNQRTLAHAIWLLRETQEEASEASEKSHSSTEAQLLSALALQIASVRSELTQFPIVYYFHTQDRRSALAAALPVLFRIAENGRTSSSAEYRLAATFLLKSIGDLAGTLAQDFLSAPSASTEEILDLYAEDHRHAPGAPTASVE